MASPLQLRLEQTAKRLINKEGRDVILKRYVDDDADEEVSFTTRGVVSNISNSVAGGAGFGLSQTTGSLIETEAKQLLLTSLVKPMVDDRVYFGTEMMGQIANPISTVSPSGFDIIYRVWVVK